MNAPPGPDRAAESSPACGPEVVLATVRVLLRVESRAEAAQVLARAVGDLGGRVVPATATEVAAGAPDLSLGVGEPTVLSCGDLPPPEAAWLRRQVPLLLEDAQEAAARCDRHQRQEDRARTDALTGLSGRSEGDARLTTVRSGDVICLLDLDDFKGLNDSRGHAAGDEALRQFGAILRANVRDGDFVGRHGGDEFLVILDDAPLEIALQRMWDVAESWTNHDRSLGVSIGIAVVDERGPGLATTAADRALYRGKRAGGGRVVLAVPGDYAPFS